VNDNVLVYIQIVVNAVYIEIVVNVAFAQNLLNRMLCELCLITSNCLVEETL
jgi:hypothetical protein